MDHVLTPVDLGTTKDYVRQMCARCSCGYLTDVVHNSNDLDNVISAHEREARRDRLGLGVRTPSLTSSLRHYEKMASHPAATVPERTQWERLAEEVRDRIVQTKVDNTLGQGSLLDMLEE